MHTHTLSGRQALLRHSVRRLLCRAVAGWGSQALPLLLVVDFLCLRPAVPLR